MNVRLYVWQRLTAAIMLPLVLLHIAVIFYASRKGMSAADILARTRGSIGGTSGRGSEKRTSAANPAVSAQASASAQRILNVISSLLTLKIALLRLFDGAR